MWHSCVAFGKLAEIIQQYVFKGTKLYIDGTISYQTYDKDGEKRYATKIIANDVSMLSSPQGSTSQNQNGGQKARSTARPPNASQAQEFEDSEIPF